MFAPVQSQTAFEETVERCREAGIEVVVLPVWYDVDDAATLAVLKRELLDGVRPEFAEMDSNPTLLQRLSAMTGGKVYEDQAEDLAKVVEKTGVVFGVTHNYTGYPLVRQARDTVLGDALISPRERVITGQRWLPGGTDGAYNACLT